MLAPYSTKAIMPSKPKPMTKSALSQPSVVGSKQRPAMKKEATPKCRELKTKTSGEKRGNPKTQGAEKKDLR
jgi:hypothetical protein